MKPFLGILALDTAFPRILGDAGNVLSYDFPARILIVSGAESLNVVKDGCISDHLIKKFCNAARELEADGAIAITSTCGFLITIQSQIANAVNIPVMVSGLSLYSLVDTTIGMAPIGILTASKKSLGDLALDAANIPRARVSIEGLEGCSVFTSAILSKKSEQTGFDASVIQKAVVEKALELISTTPEIAAIILECGNLPPYAPAIRAATGLPVFSVIDGAKLLWDASLKS